MRFSAKNRAFVNSIWFRDASLEGKAFGALFWGSVIMYTLVYIFVL